MAELDEIDYEEIEPKVTFKKPPDPVIIKGNGDITLFGMNNQFNDEFPNELHGKLAPEEFRITIRSINGKLHKSMPMNLKWLICGCLCCCCTMGCSLWPVVYLNKRTRRDVAKIVDHENHRLYHKLGMKWSLSKQSSSDSNTMMEYVLRLDFLPKVSLNQPD